MSTLEINRRNCIHKSKKRTLWKNGSEIKDKIEHLETKNMITEILEFSKILEDKVNEIPHKVIQANRDKKNQRSYPGD